MDEFLDYFLPKLAKIVPEQSALIESIATGYKILHQEKLGGDGECSDIWYDADGLCYPHLSGNRLVEPNGLPSLRVHPSSKNADTERFTQAKLESTTEKKVVNNDGSVNKVHHIEIQLSDVKANLTNALRTVNAVLPTLFVNAMTLSDVGGELFNLVMNSLLNNEEVYNPNVTEYIHIMLNNQLWMLLRVSDHYLVVEQAMKPKHPTSPKVKSKYTITLNFRDSENSRRKRDDGILPKSDNPNEEPGSKFDDDPRLEHIDIRYNITAFREKPERVVNLLKALSKMLSENELSVKYIRDIMDTTLNDEEGVDVVTVTASKGMDKDKHK